MKKNRVTPVLSKYIRKLRLQGKSAEEISDILQLPASTVKFHIKRQREGPPANIKPPGRPRCSNSSADSAIVLASKRRRTATKHELAEQFSVSARTVRRRLSKAGVRSCIAVEEDIKPGQKSNRVRWCRQHRATNFNNWFSDESTSELSSLSIPHRQFVHRKPAEKYAKCCVESGGVRTRQSLMVWGCISATGPACIEILRGNVDARRYVDILSTNLIPYIDSVPLATLPSSSFQHDNAPPHRAWFTRRFLEEEGITVPAWPPLSPDLNPIEDVWALMKKEVRRKRPHTLADLEDSIRASWVRVVTPRLCERLYASMKIRLDQVIARKGGHQ